MPNWCSNKVIIRGNTELISAIKNKLFCTMNYNGMLEQAISKTFLLGLTGVLKPTKIIKTPNCPALSNQGLGDDIPENRAYDIFLDMFNSNAALDANLALKMQAITNDIGLNDVKFVGLEQDSKDQVLDILSKHAFDLYLASNLTGSTDTQSYIDIFDRIIDWESVEEEDLYCIDNATAEINLDKIAGLPIQVYLNGFNGGLISNSQSGYHYSRDRWGTKWSTFECDNIDSIPQANGETEFTFFFSTAWSPAMPFSLLLSELYPKVDIKHLYCEIGCGVAGYSVYNNGKEFITKTANFEFSDEQDEDGNSEVSGPNFVITHFEDYSYGG